ncbi:MAG: hypothetical protein ABR529_09210 [Actinomycetota bacterium]
MTRDGALVPHAPLLLPELASDEVRGAAERVRGAMLALPFESADVVVILSPHGTTTGVYADVVGSLDDFGVPGIHLRRRPERALSEALATAWGAPMLDHAVDHGIVVPLSMDRRSSAGVVAATLAEDAEPESTAAHARSFADALRSLAPERRLLFLASANTAAALTPRAPLTERREAGEAEQRLTAGITRDAGFAEAVALEHARLAGACGAGPLIAFGRLCRGGRAEILAHECPVGVGYLVARARMS